MENVFRFALVRPPTTPDDEERLRIQRDTPFFADLTQARQSPTPAAAMKQVAAKLVVTDRFTRALAALHWGAALAALRNAIAGVDTAHDLGDVVRNAFGKGVEDLVNDADLVRDDKRLADSVLAIKVLSSDQGARLAQLVDGLRLIAVIGRLGRHDQTIEQPGALGRAMRRALLLPPSLFPLPAPTAGVHGGTTVPVRSDLDGARAVFTRLRHAADEIVALDASVNPPAAPLPRVFDREDQATRPIPESGRPAPAPLPSRVPPRTIVSRISEQSLATLYALGIDPLVVPLGGIADALGQHMAVVGLQINKLEAASVGPARVGMISRTPIFLESPTIGGPYTDPGHGTLPATHGSIRSVGVADLLVVKQVLKRYEPRDIAHIENVLAGESKKREHHVTETTEQIALFETETTRTTERDTESTDRFEMKRAASETISQDASLTAGLTVSGSYGPTVDFQSNVQGSLESSQERSSEMASSYSREVTERARTLVSERILTQRTFRQTTTIEEKNEHGIDNAGRSEFVVGIYQWLEKIYEAQIYNYGLRTMFDFIVPEPAAFAIYAMEAGFADASKIDKPKDFTLTPLDITEGSYTQYVLDWEAAGVAPPPEPFIVVSKTFRGGPDGPSGDTRGMTVDAVELPVTEGYQAISTSVVARYGRWDPDTDMSIRVTVGQTTHTFVSGGDVFSSGGLNNEVGTIPVAVRTYRTSSFTVAVEVRCSVTARAMEKWRNQTHAALLQAYQQKRAAYEEKLKALQSKAGVEIAGRNPAQNREIERRELKRACIEILTAQHFELFGSIATPPDGLPGTDVDEIALEGPYIRFFEQAFEWQNATYIFYPYFWGRRSTWIDRFQYDDVDPLFGQFLRAGAARVVVPVRPGFEVAIDHFLATSEIWNGGELPPISSEMYVPIIDEIAESLGAPGNEVPVGDPWDVAVPTSLTLLRTDSKLPKWRKTDDGEWIEDE